MLNITNQFDWEVYVVLIFCSLALSVLGVFLVLKKVSMIIDAISHSVLLGIVLAFLFIKQLNSPFLIIGGTLIGILNFYLVEIVGKNPRIKKDAAIGIVFSFFFALAILIISVFIRDVHMDTDAVFLGNVELTDVSVLKKIIPILLLNLGFIFFFYKELKIYIFDPVLASILGFSTFLINYCLITLISVTAVISFDIVGSVMTIASIIGPAAISLLLSKKLLNCILLSLWFAFVSSSLGYYLSMITDLPVAGLISMTILTIFLLVLFLEPKNGIVAKMFYNRLQKKSFMVISFLMHLSKNEKHQKENQILKLKEELQWSLTSYNKCVDQALKLGYIVIKKNQVFLKDLGKQILSQKISLWKLE
ncbi:ABC-type Zn/Mn transport system,permease component [Candidatus Phytoplasma australiense]|uniref:ABC-type Zn/Mn transport system,permease component n=3 Tax=Phytoplasma australiense TaxID=59748 RepID=B1VA45_PHYAS|nr:metal ABC transporter permease [Candidatus Phytoplasma australiense]AGL90192.1 Zinc transport system membrane protein troD [Strawberry lethal yellows phytoplasma (CPA) str. NZSb11]CAM11818.1 ABC-type Zn/Mn transport system,permease component [Candidatus Phytoplasma australiense]